MLHVENNKFADPHSIVCVKLNKWIQTAWNRRFTTHNIELIISLLQKHDAIERAKRNCVMFHTNVIIPSEVKFNKTLFKKKVAMNQQIPRQYKYIVGV